MSRQRTLLGIWAHPDDEAYLSAGLMAETRQRGDRVVVLTATLGEHGTNDPATWPPARLAALRHVELRNSLAALDVDELRVLGYEDGTLPQHDGTALIAEHIAAIAPDTIVTFGPDGMTGHPDHRAISRWVTDAWAVARPQASLWYATLTADFHRRWGATNERAGLWSDQPEPPCSDRADIAYSTTFADDLLDLKMAALRAHNSQTRPLIDLVGMETYREWWRTETFRRVDPAVLRSGRTGPLELMDLVHGR
jgi:LmbE family N-acetylglucosaminyl deacetylase